MSPPNPMSSRFLVTILSWSRLTKGLNNVFRLETARKIIEKMRKIIWKRFTRYPGTESISSPVVMRKRVLLNVSIMQRSIDALNHRLNFRRDFSAGIYSRFNYEDD